jgi:hypothetical protein
MLAQDALSLILLRRVSRVDRHDRVTLAESRQPLPRTRHRLLGALARLHGSQARPTFQDRHVCVAGGLQVRGRLFGLLPVLQGAQDVTDRIVHQVVQWAVLFRRWHQVSTLSPRAAATAVCASALCASETSIHVRTYVPLTPTLQLAETWS